MKIIIRFEPESIPIDEEEISDKLTHIIYDNYDCEWVNTTFLDDEV